jgi:hypothetical protein
MPNGFYPLDFFYELILKDERGSLWQSFLPEDSGGSIQTTHFDLDNGYYEYSYYNGENEELIETSSDFFDDFFLPTLQEETEKAIHNITAERKNKSKDIQEGFINEVMNNLKYFEGKIQNTPKLKNEQERTATINALLEIEEFITANYSLKPVLKRGTSTGTPVKLCFRLKTKYKPDILKSIFEDLEKHYEGAFLNNDLTKIDELVKLITSKDVLSENIQVRFSCPTVDIAYIFHSIFPFFSNLGWRTIYQSKAFYSKSGEAPFKESVLSKSFNYPAKKVPRTEIDSIIARYKKSK